MTRAVIAKTASAFFVVSCMLAAPVFAQTTPPAGSHVLPTAQKNQPATPTTQPGLKSTAAPTRQPTVPAQPGMNDGIGSVLTQTKALDLPPAPVIANPPEQGTAANPKAPYVPPELRDKVAPDSNLMLPPLYGWTRIIMNDLVMPSDKDVVESCGMRKDFIFNFFAQRLQEGSIPLMSREQSDRLVPDPVVAVATPTIVSMQDLVINCTSWVQFQVVADITFRVPPMMYRRKVPILLWHDGMLVTSAKSTHNGALINAFIELAMRFRNAWDTQKSMIDPRRIVQ